MGSIIVISVLMLIGVILVSDLSIGDAITNLFSKFKRKEKNLKIKKKMMMNMSMRKKTMMKKLVK